MRFVDIQVNGAFGVDFNDPSLTLEQLLFASEELQKSGVEVFFPTIITADLDKMCHQIDRIAQWVEKNSFLKKIVQGIHVEGPFISSKAGFRGTHPESDIKDATPEIASKLIQSGHGLIKLMTLAPEIDSGFNTTRWLREQGVIVFAGHTDADYSTLAGAIESGLQGFTHLGNGCAMEVNRHDNILHRVLAHRQRLFISIIADGIHIPWWLLRSWSETLSSDQLIVTSDSMSAAGMPPGEYLISNQHIVVDADRRTRHRDHQYLAGSASTMQDMVSHIHEWLEPTSNKVHSYFYKNAFELFQLRALN